MSIGLLTGYILVWPIISAGILALLLGALFVDMRTAKREGRDML